MASKEKASARYMEDPDTGKVELVAGDKIGDNPKLIEPRGVRGNGEAWNVDGEDATRDAAAATLATRADFQAEKDAEVAKKAVDDLKAQQEAGERLEAMGAMKVQIVDPPKADAKKAPARR